MRIAMMNFRCNSTVLLSICLATLCWAKPKKAADDVKADANGQTVVIVQFTGTVKTSAAIEAKAAKLKKRGGQELARLTAANASLMKLTKDDLDELDDNPDVRFVTPNRTVSMTQSQPSAESAGGLFPLRYGWTGAGIGVAVIDSGLRTEVEDTKGRVVHMESFLPGDADPKDSFGHGTHVGSIIGGSGVKHKGLYPGIAPGVRLVNLRVLDKNGSGQDSSVIAAIDRAIALKATYNIRVINLSLGRPVYEACSLDPLCQAVERAWRAGIVVVAAAGNHGRNNQGGNRGYATITAPGNSPYAITVGAMRANGTQTRADDVMASYSSKGPTLVDNFAKPDLVAPGNLIVSTDTPGDSALYKLRKNNRINKDYFKLSGTSMAAPMVSGAVALMLQKEPTLTPDQVKARLMKTAGKTFPRQSTVVDGKQTFVISYDLFTVGAGYLDVTAALADNSLATGRALSPSVKRNSNGTVTLVTGTNVVWGSSIIWGENVVWGSSVVWGENVVWGSGIIWGESIIWGENGMGRASVIWGEQTGIGAVNTMLDGEN